MIAPGQRITSTELQAVADAANSLTSDKLDVSAFKDVIPMYLDGSSNKFGYCIASNIQIKNRGSGYKRGDVLLCDFVDGITHTLSFQLEVVCVDVSGGLLGVRPTAFFEQDYLFEGLSGEFDLTSVFGSPSTSGTGGTAWFEFVQVGPTLDYSFPEFVPNQGVITGFALKDGGSGYSVGNVETFAELPGASITVDSVDGSGKILTFTVSALTAVTLMPTSIAAMTAVGGDGTGAVFYGIFTLGRQPDWRAEMERLRTQLRAMDLSSNTALGTVPYHVSGPWPRLSPSANFKETYFYYADTGTPNKITLAAESSISGITPTFTLVQPVKSSSWNYDGDGWWLDGGAIGEVDPYYLISFYWFRLDNGDYIPGPSSPLPSYYADWLLGQYKDGYVMLDKVAVQYAHTDYPSYDPPAVQKNFMNWFNLRPWNTESVEDVSGGPRAKRLEYTIRVGGDRSVVLNGSFTIQAGITAGEVIHHEKYEDLTGVVYDNTTTDPDPVSPEDMVHLSGDFPGTKSVFVDAGLLNIKIDFSDTAVAPGEYKLIVDVDVPNDEYTFYVNQGSYWVSDDPSAMPPSTETPISVPGCNSRLTKEYTYTHTRLDFFNPSSVAAASGTLTNEQIFDEAEPYPGIHNDKPIYRIKVPGDTIGFVGGVYVGYTVFSGTGTAITFTPLTFLPPGLTLTPDYHSTFTKEDSGGVLVDNPLDMWTCYIPPLRWLPVSYPDAMPWNLKLFTATTDIEYNPMLLGSEDDATATNTYDQTKVVEMQSELPLWAKLKQFTLGFSILDANGNIQTVITAGTSGDWDAQSGWGLPPRPIWSQVEGGITDESIAVVGVGTPGTVVWRCVKAIKKASTWLDLVSKAVGDAIIDSNGNTQTVLTAGTTGAVEPTWSTLYEGQTTDGTVVWKLTDVCRTLSPAVHRYDTVVANYPCYWESETIARLKPPASDTAKTVFGQGYQWNGKDYFNGSPQHVYGWQEKQKANGWWIYRVSLNLNAFETKTLQGAGTNAGDIMQNAGDGNSAGGVTTNNIAVQIGCIRDGSFVAFGTYMTGNTYQVFWPVMTTDCLVYRASARVNVQAVAIQQQAFYEPGTGDAYQVWDPICAAHFADITKQIELISSL